MVGPSAEQGGYAVAAVLFMLGMVSVLMMTGYDLIRVVGEVRSANRDGIVAEQAGEAAVARFMGERVGTPPDSQTMYLSESTLVRIRARRLSRMEDHRASYLMVARVEHGTTYPARRTVRTFAVLEPPVEPLAALSVVSGGLTVNRFAAVSGDDAAGATQCTAAPGDIGGVLAAGAIGTTGGSPISGTPATRTAGSREAALDLLGARWDYLLGSDVPVQVSSVASWPSFGTLHADSFPLIRISGDFASNSTHSGRGALIVTGTFRPGANFVWNGVIIAGGLDPNVSLPNYTVHGLMVVGMDASAGAVTVPQGAEIRYHRCHVAKAFAKLSHLEEVEGTGWTDR